MSWQDQKYVNFPFVKTTNIQCQNGVGTNAISIGKDAGYSNQELNAIAIGNNAGKTNQGTNTIAIGQGAGAGTQGQNAIAIGYQAGQTGQHNNTIVLNALGSALNSETTNAFYVKPIRGLTGLTGPTGPNFLYYNDTTGEITYSPLVSEQLIKTKIITESINANSFNGLSPSRTPGVTGNTPIASNATVTYSIDYNIFNTFPANSIISIDIDLPYDYSGGEGDYITVSIEDPTGTKRFEKFQYWRNEGGGGTRSGTIFPLSCSYKLTGSPSNDRSIILKIMNKGNNSLSLFSGRTTDIASQPLPYLSIKISEYYQA